MNKLAYSVLIIFVLLNISYSLKDYKMPLNLKTDFETFLKKFNSDSVSKADVI